MIEAVVPDGYTTSTIEALKEDLKSKMEYCLPNREKTKRIKKIGTTFVR